MFEPPPHAHARKAINGKEHSRHRPCIRVMLSSAKAAIIVTAHSDGGFVKPVGYQTPWVRNIVVAVATKVVADVPLTETAAGTEQVEPAGVTVQPSAAVPLSPAPPMDNEYVALCPAVTVAAGAVVRLRLGTPVPVKETICGLLAAPSVMVSIPVAGPAAVGVNDIVMAQFSLAATELPQLLVSEKGPVI